MAEWEEPGNSDTNHVDVLQKLADKDTHLITMGQSGSYDDKPEGSMTWDNAAKLFRRLTSGIKSIALLSVAGGGTGAGTAAGARANLGAIAESDADNKYLKQAYNGTDIVSASIFRTSINVPSKSESALNADNLGNLNSASTSFNNIKQSATESSEGVVEKASVGEMTSGIANKFPDCSVVKGFVESFPVTTMVWSGSLTLVSDAQILASSGHVVSTGEYIAELSDGRRLNINLIEKSIPVFLSDVSMYSTTHINAMAYSILGFNARKVIISSGASTTSETIVKIERVT